MYPYPITAQSSSSAASAATAAFPSAVTNGISPPTVDVNANNTAAYHSPEELRVLNIDPQATKGLFVGDLSSFCSEKDLYAMFISFGPILAIEIKRGRHGDSLLHGFVEYDSVVSSYHAVEAMHGRKIMGRRMRVNWTNIKVPPKPVETWTLVQVHFVSNNIQMRIDEEFLDNVFAPFGDVIDVIVKRHEIRQSPPQIRGFGNVYFLDTIPAMKAIMSMKGVSVSGVQFECSLTMPKSGTLTNVNSHANSGMNSGFDSGTLTPTAGGGGGNGNIISNNLHNTISNSTGSGNLLHQALSGMSGLSGTGTPPPPPQNTTSPSVNHLHRMGTGTATASSTSIANNTSFLGGNNKCSANTHSSSPSHTLSIPSTNNNNINAFMNCGTVGDSGAANGGGSNCASSSAAQQQRLLYLLEKEKELIRREKELLLREQLAVQLRYFDLDHSQLSHLNYHATTNNTITTTNNSNEEDTLFNNNKSILHLPSNTNNNNTNNNNTNNNNTNSNNNYMYSNLSISPQMSPHILNSNNNTTDNITANNNSISSSKSTKESVFSFDFIPHIASAPQSITASFYQSSISASNNSNKTNNNNNNMTTNAANNNTTSNTTSSSTTVGGVPKHPSIIAGLSLSTSSWDLNDPLYALSHSSSQPNVFLNMGNISNFPTLNNNNMYPSYNNYSQGSSQVNSTFNSGYHSGVISHTGSTSSQSTATHASAGHGSRFTFDHIPLSNNTTNPMNTHQVAHLSGASTGFVSNNVLSLPPTPSNQNNKIKPPLAMSPSHAQFLGNIAHPSGVFVESDNMSNTRAGHNINEDVVAATFSKMGIAEEFNALTTDNGTSTTTANTIDSHRNSHGGERENVVADRQRNSSSSNVDDLLNTMIDEDALGDQ